MISRISLTDSMDQVASYLLLTLLMQTVLQMSVSKWQEIKLGLKEGKPLPFLLGQTENSALFLAKMNIK